MIEVKEFYVAGRNETSRGGQSCLEGTKKPPEGGFFVYFFIFSVILFSSVFTASMING